MRWILAIILTITVQASLLSEVLQVKRIARKWQVGTEYMCKLAMVESNFNPKAKSRWSSARGLYQIIKSTEKAIRKKHKIVKGNIYDVEYNTELASALTSDNMKYLKFKGLPITYANLYAMHFFGLSDGYKFLTTNNKELTREVFPKAYKYNRALIGNNTIGELKEIFVDKFVNASGCNKLIEEAI